MRPFGTTRIFKTLTENMDEVEDFALHEVGGAQELARPDVERANTTSRWMVAAGLLVVVGSVWAFTGRSTMSQTDAGVRVDPGSAYNPVTAGESLPDGFRQLLPRDAISPIYDPTFVPADLAGWPTNTDVIGVTQGGVAKAYPVSFLSGRELVVDEIDNIPILVSW